MNYIRVCPDKIKANEPAVMTFIENGSDIARFHAAVVIRDANGDEVARVVQSLNGGKPQALENETTSCWIETALDVEFLNES